MTKMTINRKKNLIERMLAKFRNKIKTILPNRLPQNLKKTLTNT